MVCAGRPYGTFRIFRHFPFVRFIKRAYYLFRTMDFPAPHSLYRLSRQPVTIVCPHYNRYRISCRTVLIFYMSKSEALHNFYIYLLIFMGAMLGVVLSDNLFVLYTFWEMTSFPLSC